MNHKSGLSTRAEQFEGEVALLHGESPGILAEDCCNWGLAPRHWMGKRERGREEPMNLLGLIALEVDLLAFYRAKS